MGEASSQVLHRSGCARPRSLTVKVALQSMDTGEVFSTPALVDYGAIGQFIDRGYVEKNCLNTRKLIRPIPVFNVDGTRNEASSITEVVDAILHFEDHTERTTFVVTSLGSQALILGYTWLAEHNPKIDWQTRKVKMSRCPTKCQTCQKEETAECRERTAKARADAECIRKIRMGPFPGLAPKGKSLKRNST